MLQVGLTGNIATGKSQASKKFAELGAQVIDADLIAHEILNPGTDTFGRIVDDFGKDILAGDGTIDRRKLGNIVFSDPEKLEMLNSITHPRIRERIRELVLRIERDDPGALIVVDAALLIEGGLYKEMTKVVVVYADELKQVERLVKRDGLTPEEAKKRIASQMPLKEKREYADYVIDNNGEPGDTLERVRCVYRELVGKA